MIFYIPAYAAPWKGAQPSAEKDGLSVMDSHCSINTSSLRQPIKGHRMLLSAPADKRYRVLLSAPADKKTSRVPRYQNGEKLSGTAIFRVKSPHIGGDLERVDVSFVLSLRQRKDRVSRA